MPPPRRPLVVGNWKMNGLKGSGIELERLIAGMRELGGWVDTMVCPPATLVAGFADLARGSPVGIGAQDCHCEPAGAFTGDISAEMLADAGASAVIVGHSERRCYHRESDADVRAKAKAAWRAGLTAIVCLGETKQERTAGQALEVVCHQLERSVPDLDAHSRFVIAYEPVWAIGTGLTPTSQDIAEVHATIRQALVARFAAEGERTRILYGGSVKPGNARELMAVAEVDGALVGGASLKAQEFLAILAAASRNMAM
jgi:triosephosphate isomerase (TIM)